MEISYKQGAAYSVIFSVAAKAFSLISSLALAFYFGATAQTDIYFYLILAAALLNGWLQGINTGVLLPEFMHQREHDKSKAISLVNFFLYIYLIASLLIIAVCWLAPQQILSFISAFPSYEISQNLHFMGLGGIYFTSFFLMTFLISLAESYKLFNIYILGPLNSLLPLILVIATKKLEVMFIGYILAYLIQITVCVFMLKKHANWHFGFKKPQFNKKFLNNLTLSQPNNIAWAILLYAPLFMVSATQAGMISAVNYSRMLSDSTLDIFVSKTTSVAKVKMTAMAAVKNFKTLADTLFRTDKILMFVLIPFCAFSSVFAYDIVVMFFMRGSFSVVDGQNTAVFLQAFILTIPLVSLNATFSNLMSSMRIIKELVPRYLSLAIIFTVLFIICIKKWGAFAYPAVFVALYLTLTLFNIFTAKQFAPFLNYTKHILYILKLLAISLLCAFGAKYMFAFYDGNIFLKIFLNGIFFVVINSALFNLSGDTKQFKEALNIKWK